jgi:hypothetical protein
VAPALPGQCREGACQVVAGEVADRIRGRAHVDRCRREPVLVASVRCVGAVTRRGVAVHHPVVGAECCVARCVVAEVVVRHRHIAVARRVDRRGERLLPRGGVVHLDGRRPLVSAVGRTREQDVSSTGIVEPSYCTVAIAPGPASSSAHDYAPAGPARTGVAAAAMLAMTPSMTGARSDQGRPAEWRRTPFHRAPAHRAARSCPENASRKPKGLLPRARGEMPEEGLEPPTLGPRFQRSLA